MLDAIFLSWRELQTFSLRLLSFVSFLSAISCFSSLIIFQKFSSLLPCWKIFWLSFVTFVTRTPSFFAPFSYLDRLHGPSTKETSKTVFDFSNSVKLIFRLNTPDVNDYAALTLPEAPLDVNDDAASLNEDANENADVKAGETTHDEPPEVAEAVDGGDEAAEGVKGSFPLAN